MYRSFLFLSPAAFLIGCLSPDKRVAEQLPLVQRTWQAQVHQQANLPEQTLDWNQAMALARAGNLKLRAARVEITNAQENVRQIYKNFIPTLNLNSGVSRTFVGLPDISPSDVTFNINSFFNIPGLFSLSRQSFGARLTLIRAEAALALQERTMAMDLFKLFPRAVHTQKRTSDIQLQIQVAKDWLALDPTLGARQLTELTKERVNIMKEAQTLNQQIGELLGDQSHYWKIVTNGLPVLDYANFPLSDTNRVGQLQMRLTAIELAGALARQQGIKLQYWPELSIFVSGPPVIQRNAGGDQFWDVEQVRVNANLFWQLDTRGLVALQLRQQQRQEELQRERLQQESRALITKLLTAQQFLRTAQEQHERLARQSTLLANLPAPADFSGWQQIVAARRALEEESHNLQAQKNELQTLFWFLDDEKWPADALSQAKPK